MSPMDSPLDDVTGSAPRTVMCLAPHFPTAISFVKCQCRLRWAKLIASFRLRNSSMRSDSIAPPNISPNDGPFASTKNGGPKSWVCGSLIKTEPAQEFTPKPKVPTFAAEIIATPS